MIMMSNRKVTSGRRSFILSLAFFLSAILIFGNVVRSYGQETLVLAVHPYLPAPILHGRFSPLAQYLSRELGIRVEVQVGTSYEEHIQTVGHDKVDLAFMGPCGYVRLTELFGAKPLLARIETNGTPFFKGKIIARKHSSIGNLSDLRNARLAFVDPDSTMGYIVPVYTLINAGVEFNDIKSYSFLGSHNDVALGVLAGDFEAGAVKEEIFYSYRARGLKELASTPSISEHLFVTRSDLPEETFRGLREALFKLNTLKKGRRIMKAIKSSITAMVPVKDSDYDNLRDILDGLEKRGIVKYE